MTRTESFFKDIVIKVQQVFLYPFSNSKNNSDQTESYIIQKNMNDTIMKEIDELKNVLELNQTFTDYEVVNATVLSRNKSYWLQNITIDKGKKSGLEEEMIAITKEGLIGKISKVTNYTSEIKLITNNDANYKISVEIVTSNGNVSGLLSGYDDKDQTVIVTGIERYTDLQKGQNVLTSGLGGVFPRGIYIGQVQEIENDKYDLSKKIKVKLNQSFNDIHYVSILKKGNK